MGHFLTDMSNRVEHLKQNQSAIEKWPFGFVSGVQLGLQQTQALIIISERNKKDKKNACSSFKDFFFFLSVSAGVCRGPS